MSHLGLGVMIDRLFGGSKHGTSEYVGKVIKSAALVNCEDSRNSEDYIEIEFEDGVKIKIKDKGQSCCESRYMKVEDGELLGLIGGKLVDIELKDGGETEGEYGDKHEVIFLEIKTDKISVNISTHNEHNGYYGGFSIHIEQESECEEK